jgi:hypothetical protein
MPATLIICAMPRKQARFPSPPRWWLTLCVALIPCFTAVLRADVAATQPSTPREAMKAFLTAMTQGHPDAIAPLCNATDADSRVVVADFTDLAVAIAQLRKSVTAKYGASAADSVLPLMPMPDAVDDATEAITGATALIQGGSLLGPSHLIHVNGQWKLDVPALLREGDLPPDAHAYLAALAHAVRLTTRDIDAGKLDSADSAIEVLRLRQSTINEDSPATQPSTTTTAP